MHCVYWVWPRWRHAFLFRTPCLNDFAGSALRLGLRWLRSDCVSVAPQRCRPSWPPVAPSYIGRSSCLAAEPARAIFRIVMGRAAAGLILFLTLLFAAPVFAAPG